MYLETWYMINITFPNDETIQLSELYNIRFKIIIFFLIYILKFMLRIK